MSEAVNQAHMDRTALSFGLLGDDSGDRAYWLSRTPQERLEAVELLRQIMYGYDPATARLQRVLEFAEFGDG